jgi:hypothetical protein
MKFDRNLLYLQPKRRTALLAMANSALFCDREAFLPSIDRPPRASREFYVRLLTRLRSRLRTTAFHFLIRLTYQQGMTEKGQIGTTDHDRAWAASRPQASISDKVIKINSVKHQTRINPAWQVG